MRSLARDRARGAAGGGAGVVRVPRAHLLAVDRRRRLHQLPVRTESRGGQRLGLQPGRTRRGLFEFHLGVARGGGIARRARSGRTVAKSRRTRVRCCSRCCLSWLLARRLTPQPGPTALVAAFYLAISPVLVQHSVSGLETSLFAVLVIAARVAGRRRAARASRSQRCCVCGECAAGDDTSRGALQSRRCCSWSRPCDARLRARAGAARWATLSCFGAVCSAAISSGAGITSARRSRTRSMRRPRRHARPHRRRAVHPRLRARCRRRAVPGLASGGRSVIGGRVAHQSSRSAIAVRRLLRLRVRSRAATGCSTTGSSRTCCRCSRRWSPPDSTSCCRCRAPGTVRAAVACTPSSRSCCSRRT